MCGIFSYKGRKHNLESLAKDINLISYRGPENTHHEKAGNDVLFAFHRLAIMGMTEKAYKLVEKGIPFREAYRQVADAIKK